MVTELKSIIPENWQSELNNECALPYFKSLAEFISGAYKEETIYPRFPQLFNALKLCDPQDVKVVILGQDPYHGPNQANGLCFSVNYEIPIPPSLKNIFKEIHRDIGLESPIHGNLTKWAQQGVLLLNNVLSVQDAHPNSHKNKGWEELTTAILNRTIEKKQHLVFMLWGKQAQQKVQLMDLSKHLVLTAPHPSPLSAHRGFIGCTHFSQCNSYLTKHSISPIDWQLD